MTEALDDLRTLYSNREDRCEHCFIPGLCSDSTCRNSAKGRKAKQLKLPYPEPPKQVPVAAESPDLLNSAFGFVRYCMEIEKECRRRAVFTAARILGRLNEDEQSGSHSP